MFYEMLARAKPYDADNPMAIIYLHAKAPVPRLANEYARAQPIVDRLMAKAPDARFASAQEAAAILELALEELAAP